MESYTPQPVADNRWRLLLGAILVALGLTIFVISGVTLGGATDQTLIPADTPGFELVARPGCELNNGHQVCNYPDGPQVLSFYRMSQGILGPAVSDYDPALQRQVFKASIVVFSPQNIPEWRTELPNLGEDDMKVNGRLPENNAPAPDSLVSAYLTDLQNRGADLLRVSGPMISGRICDRGRCMQWSKKLRFEWLADAGSPSEVSLASLGLNRITARVISRPIPWYSNVPLILLWVIGVMVGVFGAILLIRSMPQDNSQDFRTSRLE